MALTSSISAAPTLEVALVCYGRQYVAQQEFMDLLVRHNWQLACIVNNEKSTVKAGEVAGSNAAFEFSGYAEALPHFKSEGPFLLINDTFFYNHLAWAWTKVVQQLTHATTKHGSQPLAGVWGDIRRESVAFPEKDKAYLASWFFYVPDRAALSAFQQCLDTLLTVPMPPASMAYAAYVDDWLQARSFFGGWHGHLNEETLARKRRVIRMEHRLSQLLVHAHLLHGVDERIRWFPLLRLLERMYTRWLALSKRKK